MNETFRERVRRICADDPTTIKDAHVFHSKLGEWPTGYHPKRKRKQAQAVAAVAVEAEKISHPDKIM